ncbi:hypothetical protein BJF79_07055 [Actinomadura sp. CNU-125]|uniref:hypothetical protein n=1 Tax=Actinomadura sp. CNU-125 TaxID=1904961 RepID=UPI0009663F1E|nr:hypothetical protein [Actinomadura sp. CNU-125]OLT35192.1 hypothetical protein BJF79_07055 [Actinomadura sp. CNU-125]
MTAFSDSFFLQLSREWLLHYARSMRNNDTLVGELGSQEENFELVPVPRSLLDQLALLPTGGEVDWAGEQMSSLLSSLASSVRPLERPDVPVAARDAESRR